MPRKRKDVDYRDTETGYYISEEEAMKKEKNEVVAEKRTPRQKPVKKPEPAIKVVDDETILLPDNFIIVPFVPVPEEELTEENSEEVVEEGKKVRKLKRSYIYSGKRFLPGEEDKLKGDALTAVMKKEGE